MNQKEITIFKNIKDTSTPFYRPLSFILQRIEAGKSKELIQKIRKEKDKTKRNLLKQELPAICFSGKFQKRNDDSFWACKKNPWSGYMRKTTGLDTQRWIALLKQTLVHLSAHQKSLEHHAKNGRGWRITPSYDYQHMAMDHSALVLSAFLQW